MEPSVLNSLLRYTMLPKDGNSDEILMKYYVAIKCILDGMKVNWVDFIIEEIMGCKHTMKNALAYQPYIMALLGLRRVSWALRKSITSPFAHVRMTRISS
jgi:hypothetical protein